MNRLGLGLTLLRSSTRLFNPLALFSAGEPGQLMEVDPQYLFTDTAGTTPVTAPGQAVALHLDRSKGLVLGPELVTNGDFSSPDGWTISPGSGWAISGGVATGTNLTLANPSISRAGVFPAGRFVRYSFTVTNYVSGSVFLRCYGSGGNEIVVTASANGTYTGLYLTRSDATGLLGFSATSGATLSIDNISIRELPGNHDTQGTLASRPIYGRHPASGYRNLLAASENLAVAPWVVNVSGVSGLVRTAASGTAPDGTNTATKIDMPAVSGSQFAVVQNLVGTGLPLVARRGSVWLKAASGADVGRTVFIYGPAQSGQVAVVLTDDWQRVSTNTIAASAFTNFNISSIGASVSGGLDQPAFSFLAWGAQLEVGSTVSAYQRTGAPSGLAFPAPVSYDITEAGQRDLHYLHFNGTSSFFVSPTITPGTDKVQVVAGVRKLSDAAAGSVVEFSADPNNLAGTFGLVYPRSGSLNEPLHTSRGTTQVIVANSSNVFPAPRTDVITLVSDISAPFATQRVNGAQRVSVTTTQGTGNFLAYPIFKGRRGGTLIPFNGLYYGSVIRFGPNLTADQISAVERWLAQRTGVTI